MALFLLSLCAGALTVLAPCILPLLPVILGGVTADVNNRRRPLVIIGALSLSVFVFTLLLKGSTALITVSPTFWTYVSAVILLAFGLTLLFPESWARLVLKIPGHSKPDAWLARGYGDKRSWWQDIIIGAALGPVFTTCSPTFFVILATVLPQSLGVGLIDLAAYVGGLALTLLLIAWIGQKLVDRLAWATNPYGWFKKTLGVLFILLAAAIAFGWDKKAETQILNSGFFDVTKVEQSIRQFLEGGNDGASDSTSTDLTTNASSSSTSTIKKIPQRDLGKFTEIVKPAGFINSQPFQLADLVGKKVILVDFIDYSCINCQRTFPYMNDWYSKYKNQGLEIVAIHTPEFAFERDRAAVAKAADQFKLKFPIVLDNDYATWNAYHNNSWPHKFLIDIHGRVVYDHIGEGKYEETEAMIVQLLNERKQFLGESGTVAMGTPMPGYQVQTQSPETYFGAERNEFFGNGQPHTLGQGTLTIPPTLTPHAFYLGGEWRVDREYAETQGSGSVPSQISYIFSAAKLHLVAHMADGSAISAQVLIDGKPIPIDQSGADVKDGTLTIDAARLYTIYSSATSGPHRIDIIFSKPGVRIYTFTFS